MENRPFPCLSCFLSRLCRNHWLSGLLSKSPPPTARLLVWPLDPDWLEVYASARDWRTLVPSVFLAPIGSFARFLGGVVGNGFHPLVYGARSCSAVRAQGLSPKFPI